MQEHAQDGAILAVPVRIADRGSAPIEKRFALSRSGEMGV
jgi:hypothetical protein